MNPTVDIGMVVHNDVRSDGRVRKEAAALTAQGWRVVVVGISTGEPSPPAEEVLPEGFTVRLVKPRLLRRALAGKNGQALRRFIGFAQAGWTMRQLRARVYHAHDFTGLLALALGGLWRRRFVYDVHDLYHHLNVDGYITLTEKIYRALRFVEHRLAPRAAAVITVSEPLADYIAAHLRIPRPLVLANTVDLRALQAPVPFERGGRRIVAHSGHLSPGRHLPELVAALTHLPEDVALALVGDGALREKLVAQAQALDVAHRLLLVSPVNPYNLPSTLAQADAAVVLITADTLNYQFSLPNKFFEAVAAGLPLVYSPIQEIDRLAREYDLGVVCDPDDPRRIADAIMQALEPEANARYRANALKARQVLNWEQEEKKLVALYQRLLAH